MKELELADITTLNKFGRAVWGLIWLCLYRLSPRPLHRWRVMLLRTFGAKIDWSAYIYPSSKVWAPWNLTMGAYSTLADNVDCYSVSKIVIGSHSTVSQYSYLCAASHDYLDRSILSQPQMPLLTAPIIIGDMVWITADVFIGPGVEIGDGAVVLARSVVTKDVEPWTVVSGFPAAFKKMRILRQS